MDEPNTAPEKRNHGRKWSKRVDRGFSPKELERFFSVIRNDKHKMCFLIQCKLGLRIGEAVKANISDIDFEQRTMRVENEKTKEIDNMFLVGDFYKELKEYVQKYADEIAEHDGCLIYTENSGREGHVSSDFMRNKFRYYCQVAGLTEVYKELESEGGQKGTTRKLHRLSTHSLRHTYVTRIYKSTNDPVITQKLARHSRLDTTQLYINHNRTDMLEAMRKAFGEERASCGQGEMTPEFIAFARQLWGNFGKCHSNEY